MAGLPSRWLCAGVLDSRRGVRVVSWRGCLEDFRVSFQTAFNIAVALIGGFFLLRWIVKFK